MGWPIAGPLKSANRRPLQSHAVADQLLLDGRSMVRQRQATQRRKARLIAGVFTAVAVGMIGLVTLLRVRDAQHRLENHLRTAGQSSEDVRRISRARRWVWTAASAVFLVALGYAIVALVAIARLG